VEDLDLAKSKSKSKTGLERVRILIEQGVNVREIICGETVLGCDMLIFSGSSIIFFSNTETKVS